MAQYRVTWDIELDADSPEDAARKALEIQRDPNSIATVFDVAGEDSVFIRRIDMTELAQEVR
jgi:hypothetical protein